MGIRDDRLAAGLCYRCPERRVPGKRMCRKHLDLDKERKKGEKPKQSWKVAWQARIDQGLCPICGTEPEPGFKLCELCREQRREYKKQRREEKCAQTSPIDSPTTSTSSPIEPTLNTQKSSIAAEPCAESTPDSNVSDTSPGPAWRIF